MTSIQDSEQFYFAHNCKMWSTFLFLCKLKKNACSNWSCIVTNQCHQSLSPINFVNNRAFKKLWKSKIFFYKYETRCAVIFVNSWKITHPKSYFIRYQALTIRIRNSNRNNSFYKYKGKTHEISSYNHFELYTTLAHASTSN